MRLILALLLAAGPESPWLRRDLARVAADYLVVAPPAFTGALDDLCELRARTHRVAVVRTDDVAARHGPGAEGIARFVAEVRPRFLLLAGDADRVPTFVRPSAYRSDTFLSDADLATDGLFGAVAGRFPADTVEELRVMAAKTVAYEREARPGRWQRKIGFVTGEGGFGPLIDALLEHHFSAIVSKDIPPAYDVEVAYAKPSSRYCAFPPRFNENALRMLNEGTLFWAYVGHGMRTGFDDVTHEGIHYPILEAKDAAKVEVREGLPVMVVIACYTGEFDSKRGDCVGEELFKRPRGPVAFIGGTRATQPYANALLGQKLVEHVLLRKTPTLGEALHAAGQAVLAKEDSPFRKRADAMASLVQGPSSLEPMRKDVVLHYNILGDPALVIRRPADEIELTAPAAPRPGARIEVSGKAPDGPVEVTFECPRDRFYHPTDLEGEDLEKQIARRYANANNKVVARGDARAADGRFRVELALPADLPPGRYYVKAHAPGLVGALGVDVPE